ASKLELDDLAAPGRLDLVDLVEHLHARLDLCGVTRPGGEASDERLFFGQHRLLLRVLGLVLQGRKVALLLVELEVTAVASELASVDLDDLRHEAIEQLPVMA